MDRLYAAYGSNMNAQEMALRCPQARFYGLAWLDNYGLQFRSDVKDGYLSADFMEGKKTPVVIWKVSGQDVQALDEYERYPELYAKKEVYATIYNPRTGQNERAMVFFYQMHPHLPYAMPSQSYLDCCLRAYEDLHLDMEYLVEALESSQSKYRIQNPVFPGFLS